jgi:hypothetical protein
VTTSLKIKFEVAICDLKEKGDNLKSQFVISRLKRGEMEIQVIQKKIFEIRGHKVMLDSDLAAMYEVETKVLIRR